jgi:uncharacterized membrane protein YhhN
MQRYCGESSNLITEAFPWANALPPFALSVLAVSALVVADQKQFRPGRYLFKPLAATAFIWLALALGATVSAYGSWLLAGLLCCMAGDLLLMPDNERSFLAGLIAFLCGHLLYAMAFLQLPLNVTGLAAGALPALTLSFLTIRWLLPHLDGNMKVPVVLYTLVITVMLLCSGLTANHPAAILIISGAWGFAISDVAVARRQFVKPDPLNGLWGTPLYFLSQMLLACSVALV